MNKMTTIKTGTLLGLLLVCAGVSAQNVSSVIDARQDNFLSMADTFKTIKKAEDGDNSNWETIRTLAQKNAATVAELKTQFPAGSAEGSDAKPVIWEKWDKFESGLNSLENSFLAMSEAAQTKNEDMLEDAFKSAERSCKACHRSYRVKR